MTAPESASPDRVVLWGATGQAKVIRECLSHRAVRVVAVVDNDPNVLPPFDDCPLLLGETGLEDWLRRQPYSGPIGSVVAIGGSRGRDRLAIQHFLQDHGLGPLTIVHPRAFVAGNATIGAGSQILAQAAVCVEARLGQACIVNTGATVDHECRLGDGVHVAPGAHLAGRVEAGDFSMIGTGAVVLPRLRVGEGAVVGAGAVVVVDVPPGSTVAGNPARELAKGGRG